MKTKEIRLKYLEEYGLEVVIIKGTSDRNHTWLTIKDTPYDKKRNQRTTNVLVQPAELRELLDALKEREAELVKAGFLAKEEAESDE